MSRQEIKCKVESCRFNADRQHCTLKEITVGCEPSSGQAHSQKETICASFSHK